MMKKLAIAIRRAAVVWIGSGINVVVGIGAFLPIA
jgi:hypothetical protein